MSAFPPPAAHQNFERLQQQADEAWQPGKIRLNGIEYDVAVLRGPLDWQPRADGGGTVRIQKLYVDLSKNDHPQRPEQTKLITHEGVEFKIADVDGDNATDLTWSITAVRFPQ